MIAAIHHSSLAVSPLLPGWVLAGLTGLCLLALLFAVLRRAPGAAWRAVGLAVLLLWLASPRLVRQVGTPVPDVALLVVDGSASMQVGLRAALAAAAADGLTRQAAGRPDLQLRRLDVPEHGSNGTELFAAIDAALADIPPDRRAGIIAITDGQISDVPARLAAPFNLLLPAAGEQTDRRLRIITAPGYGIVGKTADIAFAIDDLGPTPGGATAHLGWSQDGGPPTDIDVPVGQTVHLSVPIGRAGPTTLSLQADALPGEASLLNNRAALTIAGVRDRLRVLLISGEPHAGERTWRRLLKADPAVDLVHFTILRPPGKDDLTPLNQLALIAFPVHELFVQKIRQFDLIILDRFSDRGILPVSYLQNIADYVRGGGALLVSAGPEFADPNGIAAGPIGDVLPALPTTDGDAVVTGAFRPAVTQLGEHHPVTAGLAGDVADGAPRWGDWYRRIAVGDPHGEMVLSAGPGGAPLLLLDRVGDGRVALLLSDQIWLWSRGHEGGGPQAELLRRVAHWLMKQPELDENALMVRIDQGVLHIERRTTDAGPAPPAIITDPDGRVQNLKLTADGSGQTASVAAATPGLWQVRVGNQRSFAAEQPGNPLEFADLRATATRLAPVATSVHWLDPAGPPALEKLDLRRNHALLLTGIETTDLLPAWLALLAVLAATLMAWWREGRERGC